jgi:Flp pilus assembly protein TadG
MYFRTRNKRQRGQAVLETALCFLIFAVLVLGVFDFGQFLFVHEALVERARYSVRWGAINGATDHTSIQNMVLYSQSATPTDGRGGYFGLTSSNVSVNDVGSGTDNYYLTVKISGYNFTSLSPYLPGSMTGPAITVSVPLGLYN